MCLRQLQGPTKRQRQTIMVQRNVPLAQVRQRACCFENNTRKQTKILVHPHTHTLTNPPSGLVCEAAKPARQGPLTAHTHLCTNSLAYNQKLSS